MHWELPGARQGLEDMAVQHPGQEAGRGMGREPSVESRQQSVASEAGRCLPFGAQA